MNTVTVITPTYNRAYTLGALYHSLVSQTDSDFQWIIVDDGSTDNTEELCNGFAESSDFPVIYIKKENGGKHSALNEGIKHIDTPLTIIVDSDDKLTEDAIETIKYYYELYKTENVSVFAFQRCDPAGKKTIDIGQDIIRDDYIRYRIKNNLKGDMAEVFITEVLKRYPFPVFDGEKFLSEDVVWIELAKSNEYLFINKAIYICEYLNDGLTSNDKPAKFASPMGSMLRGYRLMSPECGLMANIRGAIIYDCYRIAAGCDLPKEYSMKAYQRILCKMLSPAGMYYNKRWSRQK